MGIEQKQPISDIVVIASLVEGISQLHKRAEMNYHDLLVLMGPEGQKGTVRLITSWGIALNPIPYSPFVSVLSAARQVLSRRISEQPNSSIIGVGTAVGIRGDLTKFFAIDFGVYYAGGTELVASRGYMEVNLTQGRFYVAGPNGLPTTIAPNNIHPISRKTGLPDFVTSFDSELGQGFF